MRRLYKLNSRSRWDNPELDHPGSDIYFTWLDICGPNTGRTNWVPCPS